MPLYCKDFGVGFGEIVKFFRDKGLEIKVTSSKRESGPQGDTASPIILERVLEAPSIYQNQLPFEKPFKVTDKGWFYISHFSGKLEFGDEAREGVIERTYIKFVREPLNL